MHESELTLPGYESSHEKFQAEDDGFASSPIRCEPRADFRHDLARRRAIAGREHEHRREARNRPALVGLGVDVIEAGFPIASVGDFEAVRAIATEVTGSSVCGLARCNERDIDRAWEAIQFAQKPRIHVFLATSAIHREHKLRMSKAQIIDKAVDSVRRAKSYCPDIEFSPEDAARTELDFLCEVVEAAIEAGATTVNIPDTVGYATPLQYAHGHPHAQGARAQYRAGDHQHPLP